MSSCFATSRNAAQVGLAQRNPMFPGQSRGVLFCSWCADQGLRCARSCSKAAITAAGFAPATLAFVLAGCNTVKGVGQDVQRAGGAIERAANK